MGGERIGEAQAAAGVIGQVRGQIGEGSGGRPFVDEVYVRKTTYKTVYDSRTGDVITISQANFNAMDLNGDGNLSQKELEDAERTFKLRKQRLESNAAGALYDNFEPIAKGDGDTSGISGLDLVKQRQEKAALKKEGALLDQMSAPSMTKLFTLTNDGQKDVGLTYQEIDHALKNDKLSANEREMLGYLMLNFDRIKAASDQDTDKDTISLADLAAYRVQRKKEIPDYKSIDASMTYSVPRKVPVQVIRKVPVNKEKPLGGEPAPTTTWPPQ
ncbi:MAG TPA: hypothetical protein V6D17_11785 [Candidatus Obscuribacterales bacterium]